jgi:hypothetical protein
MNKQCTCQVRLGLVEAALKQASTIPHDSQLLGIPVLEAVENLLRNQQARIRANHERHTSNEQPVHING